MSGHAVTLVLSREHFRRLVAGHVVIFHAPAQQIHVHLDLDAAGWPTKFTDPSEAAGDLYPKPKKGQ